MYEFTNDLDFRVKKGGDFQRLEFIDDDKSELIYHKEVYINPYSCNVPIRCKKGLDIHNNTVALLIIRKDKLQYLTPDQFIDSIEDELHIPDNEKLKYEDVEKRGETQCILELLKKHHDQLSDIKIYHTTRIN